MPPYYGTLNTTIGGPGAAQAERSYAANTGGYPNVGGLPYFGTLALASASRRLCRTAWPR
jgi:hypothetical protein